MRNVANKMMLLGINLYLYWGALQDIKERKIQDSYIKLGGCLGIFLNITDILMGTFSLNDRIAALLPGVLFLILAEITKEQIGFGDGMILGVLGNILKAEEMIFILGSAMMLLMLYSVFLLQIKKVFENCQIPFLPFLWISHTLLWGIKYG